MAYPQHIGEAIETATRPSDFISVSLLGSGWAAMHWTYDPDGFWDVQQTGISRYKTRDEAIIEARIWSKSDGIALHSELL